MDVRDTLRAYVDALADIPDLGYAHLPAGMNAEEEAAYLLLAASVDEQADADRVHALVRGLWDRFGRRLFGISDDDAGLLRADVARLAQQLRPGRWIGIDAATQCLVTASRYAGSPPTLVRRSASFLSPLALLDDIARHVYPRGDKERAVAGRSGVLDGLKIQH